MIAIAGAGVAGLTTALALAATGVDVTLFEAAAALSEAGAGVQLSPNGTRILRDLGLLDAVGRTALPPEEVRIRRGRDGATLARLPLGASAEQRYGAPFLVAHRADLQAALLDAVRSTPTIALRLGERVEAVAEDAGQVTLSVSMIATGLGKGFEAEGLIGADGLHSRIRPHIAGRNGDPLVFSGRTAWRTLVPAAAAPAHAREPRSNLWLGRKAHLVHYPLRDGALINVVAIIEDARPRDATPDLWAVPGEAARLIRGFAGWSAEALALLEAAPEWRVWPLFERRALPRWCRGAVALAGDAAHPMLPFLAQGATQAIEDGAAIAAALGSAPSVAAGLAAFDRARRPRAERVQRESRRQGVIYHLARPAALARDSAFAMLGPARMLARYDWLYGA